MAITNTVSVNLEMDSPNNLVLIHAVQGEYYSRQVTANLYNNGSRYTIPNEAIALIRYRKPDASIGFYDFDAAGNRIVTIPSAGTYANKQVIFTIAPEMCDIPGRVFAHIDLYSKTSGNRLSAFYFELEVERAATDPEIMREADVGGVTDLVREIIGSVYTPSQTPQEGAIIDNTLSIPGAVGDAKAMGDVVLIQDDEPDPTIYPTNKIWIDSDNDEDGVELAEMDDIVSAFSSSKIYSYGDYTNYQGHIYKYIYSINTSGAWDASKWERVVLSNEIGPNASYMTDKNFIVFERGSIDSNGLNLDGSYLNNRCRSDFIKGSPFIVLPYPYRLMYVSYYDSTGVFEERLSYADANPSITSYTPNRTNKLCRLVVCKFDTSLDCDPNDLNRWNPTDESLIRNAEPITGYIRGYVSSIDGSTIGANNRLIPLDYKLSRFFKVNRGSVIKIADGFKYSQAIYSDAYSEGFDHYVDYKVTETVIAETTYISITIAKTNDSVIAVDDVKDALKIYTLPENRIESYKDSLLFRPVLFGPSNLLHYYKNTAEMTEDFIRTTNAETVFSAFNDLCDGTRLTNRLSGTASDGSDIYTYRYHSPTTNTYQRADIAKPKIIIVAGQHGEEKNAPLGLYYFIKDLITNTDDNEFLDYIRYHIDLVIAPIMNPYGFTNITYKNANNVNLNRNYDYRFEEYASEHTDITDNSYGGTAAFSEPETIIVRDLVRNNPNAIYCVDFHTNGASALVSAFNHNWHSMFGDREDPVLSAINDAAAYQVSDLSGHWWSEYLDDVPNGEMLGRLSRDHVDYPTLSNWCIYSENIASNICEGFAGFLNQSTYTPNSQRANSEIIGNWVKNIISFYSSLK